MLADGTRQCQRLPKNFTLQSVSSMDLTSTSSAEKLTSSYDYIIIGGGTAGLTIACRLSEDPNIQVLVLEAGANRLKDPNILTPGLVGALYDNPDYDWEFKTVPQKILSGRQIPHPRGKVLGGSSAIYQNKITYNSKAGFDAWEKAGNEGWNYTSIEPYLRKFHTYNKPTTQFEKEILDHCHVDEVLSGDDGPIQTSFSDAFSQTDKDFYKVVKEYVKKEKYDEKVVGGVASPSSIDPKTNSRSFAGVAYYNDEAAARPNLRIITEALVERIILEKQNASLRATGVQFLSVSGQTFKPHANREVILCAGTFHSPAILELSGIGSREILTLRGIDTLLDNPNVGENLQDHAVVAVSFEAAEGIQTADAIGRNPQIMGPLIEMYQKDGSGPLGQFFTASAYMPLPSFFGSKSSSDLAEKLSKSSTAANDKLHEKVVLDLLSHPDAAASHYFMAKIQMNVGTSTNISEYFLPKHPEDYITLFVSQNFPFSRGSVHIASSNSHDKPIVDPKYLSHPLDIELLARQVQFFHHLTSTAPFSHNFKPGGKRIPEYAFADNREPTVDEAKQIVKDHLLSHFHPVGSCAMLPREQGGVVDTELRVYGTEGLRVVDASVFPLNVRGNSITAVYAVAERAVDIIRGSGKGS
ncbi:aryl-alcohol dehydrogenase protein [Rutstroemia sp. NJR-2017a BBW]|nr:aryl-alcohol dehydrogenase protein [Rutstroemia sp. NJR-2017a BBW]